MELLRGSLATQTRLRSWKPSGVRSVERCLTSPLLSLLRLTVLGRVDSPGNCDLRASRMSRKSRPTACGQAQHGRRETPSLSRTHRGRRSPGVAELSKRSRVDRRRGQRAVGSPCTDLGRLERRKEVSRSTFLASSLTTSSSCHNRARLRWQQRQQHQHRPRQRLQSSPTPRPFMR